MLLIRPMLIFFKKPHVRLPSFPSSPVGEIAPGSSSWMARDAGRETIEAGRESGIGTFRGFGGSLPAPALASAKTVSGTRLRSPLREPTTLLGGAAPRGRLSNRRPGSCSSAYPPPVPVVLAACCRDVEAEEVFIRESSSALFILRTGLFLDSEPVEDVLELFFSRGGGASGRVESSAERKEPTSADLFTAAGAATGDEGSGGGGGGGGALGEEKVDGVLDARTPTGGGAVTDPDRERGEVGW